MYNLMFICTFIIGCKICSLKKNIVSKRKQLSGGLMDQQYASVTLTPMNFNYSSFSRMALPRGVHFSGTTARNPCKVCNGLLSSSATQYSGGKPGNFHFSPRTHQDSTIKCVFDTVRRYVFLNIVIHHCIRNWNLL